MSGESFFSRILTAMGLKSSYKPKYKTVVELDKENVLPLGARIIEDDMVCLDGTSVRHDAMKTAFLIFSYLMGK